MRKGLFLGSHLECKHQFLMPLSHCFDYDNFVMLFEIGESNMSSFVLVSHDYFGYFFLWFYTNFRIIGCSSVKNAIGILIKIPLNW